MITSMQNKTVKELLKLKQKKYRKDYYLVETNHLVEEAIKAKQTDLIISTEPVDLGVENLVVSKEIMEKLYRELMEQEWIDSYRVAFHDPIRYPGCANIKIYIKDATRENMLRNLKALLNLDKVITFGSVEGRYDVCIEDTGKDEMVKTLKKLYEPVGLEKETVR